METFELNRHPDFRVLVHGGLEVMTYSCVSVRFEGRRAMSEPRVGIAGVVESWGFDERGPYAKLRALRPGERDGIADAARASYSISDVIFR